MFAKSSPGDGYHLLKEDAEYTLCGLKVVPIVIHRAANTSTIHLTSNRPLKDELCKDCEKAAATDRDSIG